MNWRAVTIVSVGLNILLGAVVLKSLQNPAERAAAGDSAALSFETNRLTRTITNYVDQLMSDPAPEVIWPRWNEIASDDWMEYRRALERIGCPVATLRDILGAEIRRQQFTEQQELMEPVSRVFWDVLASHGLDDGSEPFKKLDSEMEQLGEKYAKLAEELFGGMEKNQTEPPQWANPTYSHLDDETQTQLNHLEVKFGENRNAILIDPRYRGKDDQLTTEGNALLSQLTVDLATDRRNLMSEEQFHEYRLRDTGAANWTGDLAGFEPTEEEFRQVAEWKVALEDEFPLSNRGDWAPESRAVAEAGLAAKMKELFGEERYAEYDRAKQSDYQSLYELGDRFDLPDATVDKAWEMQRAAQATAGRIRNDSTLTSAGKDAALRAIQQETRQSFESLLSDDVFQAYQRKSGGWIVELSPIVE